MFEPKLLIAVEHSAIAHAIAKSNHLVIATLQIVHVLGFLLLLASLVFMSLRLLGLALTQQAVSRVTRDPTRLLWAGLTLAVISGSLLFLSGPSHYFYNRAFECKMLLLLTAVVVQVTVFRKAAGSDSPSTALAMAGAVLSLLLWFSIGVAGRAIGFVN